MYVSFHMIFCFYKQNTAYELRISDWSSDVCSSDLQRHGPRHHAAARHQFHIGHVRKAAELRVEPFRAEVDVQVARYFPFALDIDAVHSGAPRIADRGEHAVQVEDLQIAVAIVKERRVQAQPVVDRKSTRLNQVTNAK